MALLHERSYVGKSSLLNKVRIHLLNLKPSVEFVLLTFVSGWTLLLHQNDPGGKNPRALTDDFQNIVPMLTYCLQLVQDTTKKWGWEPECNYS